MSLKVNRKTVTGSMLIALAFSDTLKAATSWVYPFIVLSLLVMLYMMHIAGKAGLKRGRYLFRQYFILGMIPYIIIFIYSVLIITINHQGTRFLSRSLGSTLIALMTVITSASIVFLYNKQAPDIFCYGLIINYAVHIVINFSKIGLNGLIQHIADPLNTYQSVFEAHNIGFTLNLLLIYYLFKRGKANNGKIIAILICLYLIMKRIAFAGLLLALFAWFVLDVVIRKKDVKKYRIILWGLAIASLAYVGFICLYPNLYRVLMIKLGILNRYIMTDVFSQYYSFDVSFLGRGFGFVSVMIPDMDIAGASVAAIHNDILKDFIEEGFIGFCLVYYYFFVRLPSAIMNKSSRRSFSCITMMLIYTFVTLMTDNVLDYVSYTCTLFTVYGVLHMYGTEILPDNKTDTVVVKNKHGVLRRVFE